LFTKGPSKTAPANKAQKNFSKTPDQPASLVRTDSAFADAYASETRALPSDLELTEEGVLKAKALSEFATALIAEDDADAERALAGFRKTLEADPGYTELALKVAYELSKRNDAAAAIQVLKDAIKAAPKEPLPLVYLSQLYSRSLKKPDLALKYAEQAYALAPDNIACALALFELHIASGETKKAAHLLEQAAKVPSRNAKYWIQLGELAARLYLKEDGATPWADLTKINAHYRKAIDFGKTDAGTLAKAADYFILSRQIKEAVPLYRAAIQLGPKSTEPGTANLREKLARALILTDQRNEAIGVLEEITRETPNRFETFELLGELYEQKGEFDKAFLNYSNSLKADSSDPRNHLRLAELLLRSKRYEQALETLRNARAKFPDRPDLTFSLAVALSRAKKHTQSMTVFAEALAEARQSHEELLTAEFYFQYGAAAEQAGRVEKAAELIKRSIELDPANAAQAYNYLGYMWVDRGENLQEATELIQKALAMEPDNGAFVDSLGWAQFKQGLFEEALKNLLRAVDLVKPEDPVVLEHVGDTYRALGKTPEAIDYWKRALALDAENKALADKLKASANTAEKRPPDQAR
jgi:tetratricopeptide (TPR) repeat protein